MAGLTFTTKSVPLGEKNFVGGLNTTSGPLNVSDNESSDLQNIDFNKYGSILKRNGYATINTGTLTSSPAIDGLHWYEYASGGTSGRMAICVAGGKLYQMNNDVNGEPNGIWNNITGLITITSGHHCDFENYENSVFITNGYDKPFLWNTKGGFLASVTTGATLGTNYVVGDCLILSSGDTRGNLYVTSVSASTGAVISINLNSPGSGYSLATGVTSTQAFLASTGSGAVFNILATTNSAVNMAVPYGLTKAKFVRQFNNYLFLANVTLSGVSYPSRIYWSNIRNTSIWESDQWIEVSKDDGMQITGLKVLSDRLVIYKERAIYNLYFTGDADFPFILPGGGKSNSSVGCIAPWSIQEIENGHVFLSYDGLYYYDGNNSYKLSTKVSTTLGLDKSNTSTVIFEPSLFSNSVSCVQKTKNRYFLALSETLPNLSTTNNGILVWDYYNNAFSLYTNINPSSMSTFYINGIDERPCFGDYSGFIYRMDYGSDDYPLNVQTAIDSYYYTNWKTYNDLADQKGVSQIYLYYRNESNPSVLTFAYSYDFQNSDVYIMTINLNNNSYTWGGLSTIWGSFVWTPAGGGGVKRLDLTGRGRVVRYKFANNILSQTFRIDGLGTLTHLETHV